MNSTRPFFEFLEDFGHFWGSGNPNEVSIDHSQIQLNFFKVMETINIENV